MYAWFLHEIIVIFIDFVFLDTYIFYIISTGLAIAADRLVTRPLISASLLNKIYLIAKAYEDLMIVIQAFSDKTVISKRFTKT